MASHWVVESRSLTMGPICGHCGHSQWAPYGVIAITPNGPIMGSLRSLPMGLIWGHCDHSQWAPNGVIAITPNRPHMGSLRSLPMGHCDHSNMPIASENYSLANLGATFFISPISFCVLHGASKAFSKNNFPAFIVIFE